MPTHIIKANTTVNGSTTTCQYECYGSKQFDRVRTEQAAKGLSTIKMIALLRAFLRRPDGSLPPSAHYPRPRQFSVFAAALRPQMYDGAAEHQGLCFLGNTTSPVAGTAYATHPAHLSIFRNMGMVLPNKRSADNEFTTPARAKRYDNAE